MRLVVLIVLLCCAFSQVNAQEPSYAVKNDKVYLVHIVEGGQTLYSLTRMYEVSVDEIIADNPSVDEGLQIGQRILIPTNLTPDKVKINGEKEEDLELCEHKVRRRETLFGISREYEQSQAELIKLNPEIESGLKVGQIIRVRCKTTKEQKEPVEAHTVDSVEVLGLVTDTISDEVVSRSFEDSIVSYVVQQGETLYAISKRFMVHVDTLSSVNVIKGYRISPGDTLLIPLKKERIEPVKVRPIAIEKPMVDTLLEFFEPIGRKENYTISFLLPFKIEDNAQILEDLADQTTRLNRVTSLAIEFYLGAKMALDSLEKLGFNATVHFFDTKGNEDVVKSLLTKKELLTSDLVIGPFYPKTIELVSEWGKENKKQVVIPVGINTSVLKNNPYIFSSVPSELTLFSGVADYIVDNYSNASIIIAEGNSIIERDRIDFFIAQLNQLAQKNNIDINYNIVALGSGTGRDLARKFELDSLNIFISLATDAQHVMRFVNTLNAAKNSTPRHSDTPIIVFGAKEWLDINALTSYYKNRFNLHVPLSTYVDYESDYVIKFVSKVQEEYAIDPSRFFMQGFDLTFHIIASQLLDFATGRGYMNDFDFVKLGAGHAHENQTTFIIAQKDFELIKKEVVKKQVELFPVAKNEQEVIEENNNDEGED